MRHDSGLVLISAMLLLAFLALVGSALLSTATVDTLIADNYRDHTRLWFLAEAGIHEAREQLRTSGRFPSVRLAAAAGPDGTLETAPDLAVLRASDDLPLASGTDDPGINGSLTARWHVYLRNDIRDGAGQVIDTNGLVTLVSFAVAGGRAHRVEADVVRSEPPVTAALTLGGPAATIGSSGAGLLRIVGTDSCGLAPVRAIGTMSDTDRVALRSEIPAGSDVNYPGLGPVPDIENVAGILPGYLKTVAGLERLVARLDREATDRIPGNPALVGSIGSQGDPHIVVVSGDAVLGPGTGYGILVVRGVARVASGFQWNGPILVIGQGQLDWSGRGDVYGTVFVARTRNPPTVQIPLGPLLASPGTVTVDFSGGDGNIVYDSCVVAAAYDALPLSLVAFRDY